MQFAAIIAAMLFLSASPIIYASSTDGSCAAALNAMRRFAYYIERDERVHLLDVFIGTRMVADQLLAMSEEGAAPCQRGNDEYEELAKRFDRLTLRGAERSRRADPHYYEVVRHTVERRRWLAPRVGHHQALIVTLPSAKSPEKSPMQWKINETLSDQCFQEITARTACEAPLSSLCEAMLTLPLQRSYALAHQILALVLLDFACADGGQTRRRKELCRAAGRELDSVESEDVRVELVVACQLAGYSILRSGESNWIRRVVSHQTAGGCFSLDEPKWRVKRREQIDAQCSLHLSAVSAATLASSVRQLMAVGLDSLADEATNHKNQ